MPILPANPIESTFKVYPESDHFSPPPLPLSSSTIICYNHLSLQDNSTGFLARLSVSALTSSLFTKVARAVKSGVRSCHSASQSHFTKREGNAVRISHDLSIIWLLCNLTLFPPALLQSSRCPPLQTPCPPSNMPGTL